MNGGSDEITEEIRALIQRRNIFQAVNKARAAISAFASNRDAPLELRLLEVEALQKIRAAAAADLRLRQLGLDEDVHGDGAFNHRRALLAARIKRDCALRRTSRTADPRTELHNSALAFEDMFNSRAQASLLAGAATSYAYAGEISDARRCAEGVLRILERGLEDLDDFVSLSIQVSAKTILTPPGEQPIDARETLAKLLRTWEETPERGGNEHDRARVLRRLRLLCEAVEVDAEFLNVAKNLKIVHYIGHPFDPKTSADERRIAERNLQAKIDEQMRTLRQKPVAAFGSLSAGAEIMLAEALLDQGAELHVQIPCLEEDFIRNMVAPMGGDWVVRYFTCIRKSKYGRADVTNPCQSAVARIGEDLRLTAEVAMGRTLLQAQRLEADAAQIAATTDGPLLHWGPLEAHRFWAENSFGAAHNLPIGAVPFEVASKDRKPMEPVAILFSDVSGFSRLNNDDLDTYSSEFLEVMAAAFNKATGGDHLHLNTWGDAIFAVFESVETAAAAALALQDAAAEYCRRKSGPLSKLMMRIALHHGPALPAKDPLTGDRNFFGAAITLGARVEPVTTAGAVMMTEAFAAKLALADSEEWLIDFVGETRLPKNYGETSLYLLSNRSEAPKLPKKTTDDADPRYLSREGVASTKQARHLVEM